MGSKEKNMADKKQEGDREQRVLRVNQLDATLLDGEIVSVLRSQLTRAFKFFDAGMLSKIEPELNAVLRAVIWKFSVYNKGSTVGQEMLNMKYNEPMSSMQKIVFGLVMVGGRYLQDRSTELKKILTKYGNFTSLWKFLRVIEKIVQVASLINFLIFLQKGRFQSLLERFLGIYHIFEKQQSVRQVSFEFMTRELLWHSFAEFLFFLLPLINIRQIKNLVVRQFSRPTLGAQPKVTVAYHKCGICGESPTAPHQGACDHVFCYYCIKGNSLADSSFPCPLCGTSVGEDILPVVCTVALQVK